MIRDPIWGEILIYKWEKTLLNCRAFNRLHDVLQNSNGYRVYPGARHSRFLHTLGTMHVANEITAGLFRNHFYSRAAQRDVLPDCTAKLRAECELISSRISKALPKGDLEQVLAAEARPSLPDDLFLVLCAVRMAALLHDIGHLPYSHVFEDAIDRWVSANGISMFQAGCAIHEQIGHQVARFLIKHDSHTKDDPVFCAISEAAISILHDVTENGGRATPHFQILRSIISGVVDADRIDYVRRDGELSGFMKSGVDYQRLFRNFTVSMRVVSLKLSEGRVLLLTDYFVKPSARAQSELEKLLWERYQEYSYVIGHHKVALFDEIMRRLICYLLVTGRLRELVAGLESLGELQFKGGGKEGPAGKQPEIEPHIGNVVRLFEFFGDDAYIDATIKSLRGGTSSTRFEDQHFQGLVTAYCSRRNHYVSVFKRDEDFWALFRDGSDEDVSITQAFDADPKFVSIVVAQEAEEIEKVIWDSAETKGLHVLMAKSPAAFDVGFDGGSETTHALGSLARFLTKKRDAMRPFNLWYVPSREIVPRDLVQTAGLLLAVNVSLRGRLKNNS